MSHFKNKKYIVVILVI